MVTPSRVPATELRRRVRRERGVDSSDGFKTAQMFKLERKYGKSIQELLSSDGLTGLQIAGMLGITEGAVSKWRKRFRLPTSRRSGTTPFSKGT